MKKILVLMILPVLVFALPSCDGSSSGPSTQPLPTGVIWSLQAFERNDGTSISTIVVGEPPRYQVLFREDGQVEIKADCNGCGGTYESSGSALTIGIEICTQVFCGADSFDVAFKAALEAARSFTYNGTDLVIVYPLGRMLFRM
jgi:heat shock protein HslJ